MVWKLVWQNSLELLFYKKKVISFLFFLALWSTPARSLPCARARSWAVAQRSSPAA
jgi:hypothetical protein